MDVLSLIRDFKMNNKPIEEKNGKVIFGEFAWPKDVHTNFIMWGTGTSEEPTKYYTAESILFLLKHVDLPFSLYMREAVYANIPVVRLADKKDLMAFLDGKTSTCASIDKSVPLDLSLRTIQTKRSAESEGGDLPAKKVKLDVAKELRVERGLERARPRGVTSAPPHPPSSRTSSLQEAMSLDRINAIKRKRLANKQTKVKGDGEGRPEALDLRALADADADVTQNILDRERPGRNRNSVLRSASKHFAKDVFTILQSVKAREEGSRKPARLPKPSMMAALSAPRPQHGVGYSRYDQEKFRGKEETERFQIDTMGTYHGMTLKSVTEGVSAKTPDPPRAVDEVKQQSSTLPRLPSSQGKVSRTPIVVIPASGTALITMLNAKDVLQDLRYMSVEDKRASGSRRENEILIHRRKDHGVTIPYRIIDNPLKLSMQEWDRVVAVFVQGPAWQFKGWPWGGNPVDIFCNIPAFHLKWAELPLDHNVKKWAVEVISLDRNRRHWDRASLQIFWEKLDKYLSKNKPHLRW